MRKEVTMGRDIVLQGWGQCDRFEDGKTVSVVVFPNKIVVQMQDDNTTVSKHFWSCNLGSQCGAKCLLARRKDED
jgi:hypothetical protein